MDADAVTALLDGAAEPADETEAACLAFVRAASENPSGVTAEILAELKHHLTPPQIVELACVVGFWKMYNCIHESLHVPIEEHFLKEDGE